jgi:rhodanese-related sulfurtransferase/uncharacterized membrane protein YedE/YeeE
MMAPLYANDLFGYGVSLIIAVFIGIAFGFFLERGGLGSSTKLAAQFYLTDLSVFKVMFTAIVTAMLGLYWLSRLGFLDLSQVYVNPTYMLPQLAGGFLFGIGFITAGLCPGTSCVALATGKMDGLVVLVGIFFGIFLFGETLDYFYDFMYSTSLGQVTLPPFFHIPHGLVVLFVVLVAIAGFFGAGVVERRFSPSNRRCCTNRGIKKPEPKVTKMLGIIALLLGVMAAVSGSPVRNGQIDAGLAYPDSIRGRQIAYLGSVQLAESLMARRRDMTVLDLRSETDFETYHIPSAQHVAPSDVTSHNIPNDKTIILCADDGQCAAQAWSDITEQGFENVFVLQGGLERWFDEILFPDLTVTRGRDKDTIEKIRKMSRYFGGTPRQNDIGRSGSRRRYLREGC